MLTLSKFLRHIGSALALAAASLATHAAPVTTQLGFLIDASGSIGSSNFQTMRNGYAAALNALPTDGSIEVTVVTFSSGTTTVVAPTVVTAASLPGIVAAINGMAYPGSTTNTAAGITAITNLMTASSNFSSGISSMINIATDGAPDSSSAAISAATTARNKGIDSLTAEYIGGTSSGQANFLRDLVFSPVQGPCNDCGTLLAAGSTPTDPMTTNPWVLPVNSFDDFPTAIMTKVQVATGQVPEPGILVLLGLGLAVAGVARRSRSA
ncbi:VWA domain-containing protein [Alicycliphilus denitrificans]|uniref:VWA domain-containing protein n=1 Tax=Alicycliphilus denitrificans TaxID=179636 RepID=A0A420KEP4_9BURK|nr:VWA domain-containing protein [Alicycliphilus denitrificans]RKJ98397.1 VWA domain-containing protein [Alicycliphilus denitrificans]